jgi:translation initiation factor 2 subunit 2
MADVEQSMKNEDLGEKSEEMVFDGSLKKKKKSKPSFEGVDEVSEVTDMMAELGKKKKKKEKKPEDEETVGEQNGDDSGFEFKKKKKKSKSAATSEFEQQLEQAGVAGGEEDEEGITKQAISVNEAGELDFTYEEMLSRFFVILRENNPDLAGDRTGIKYKIPPPLLARDGNKKSLFSNVKEIADRMHRPTEHVIQFLFAELGTSGSVDGSNRLVIRGRFQQKQIETVLRRYILEYVTCKTCKSVNTKLTKENRLYFLDCNSCGSRRSVSSIKTGFQAVIRRARK